MRGRSIKYYDPYGYTNNRVSKVLSTYLQSVHFEKTLVELDMSNWRSENVGVPRQHNGCDCGVHCCMYAEIGLLHSLKETCHNGIHFGFKFLTIEKGTEDPLGAFLKDFTLKSVQSRG